jgi:hypothetical protein
MIGKKEHLNGTEKQRTENRGQKTDKKSVFWLLYSDF